MLQTVLLVVHLLVSLALIGIILLQRGQGATTGAAFGSGASSTVFGARGSASFLTRTTAILALLFLANSMFLAYRYGKVVEQNSLLDRVVVRQDAGPAAPAPDLPAVAIPDDGIPEVAPVENIDAAVPAAGEPVTEAPIEVPVPEVSTPEAAVPELPAPAN